MSIIVYFCMKCSEVLKMLKSNGWQVVSQRGSHLKLIHNDKIGVIIFPNHGSKELGKGLEKTILKQAGIKNK